MTSRRASVIVLLAVGLGALAQYLVVGERPGVNVPLAAAAFLGSAWLLRDPRRPVRATDLWLPAGALGFAVFCALRADAALLAFDTAAVLLLCAGTVVALRGTNVAALPLGGLIAEALALTGALLSRAGPTLRDAWPALRRTPLARSSRAGGYAAGVALSVPLLVVFAALFSSADPVFHRGLTDIFDIARLRDLLAELPARTVLAVVVAWCAAGALAWLWLPPAGLRPGRIPRVAGADVLTAMFVAIDALFAVFVVVQIAYLFGGRDTVAAAGVTYSAYARRGFFELVGVASIVGLLLFGCDLLARDRTRSYRIAALGLVGLAGVVLVSAGARMDLYQRAYGWTELRFYACVAIAYLAIALAILAWAVVRSRMDVTLQRLAIAGMAVALGVNAIGPTAVVARANIERFTSPEPVAEGAYRDIDLGYLVRLGDGAVPTIAELQPALPEPERTTLDDLLRLVARRTAPPGGWQSWNLDRSRAAEVLRRY